MGRLEASQEFMDYTLQKPVKGRIRGGGNWFSLNGDYPNNKGRLRPGNDFGIYGKCVFQGLAACRGREGQ